MADKNPKKVLIRRAQKPGGPNADASDEVELVSTQMLKQILSSRDVANRKGVADAARAGRDGVLARDPVTGHFVIIEDDELQAIVDSGQNLPKLSKPADVTVEPLHDYADSERLSLVSIQALRRIFADEAAESDVPPGDGEDFDPYVA